MKEELLKGLTEEQIAKLRECKNVQEMMELAKNEDIQLNEEQLNAISGGGCVGEPVICPICSSDRVTFVDKSSYYEYTCNKCGFIWKCE